MCFCLSYVVQHFVQSFLFILLSLFLFEIASVQPRPVLALITVIFTEDSVFNVFATIRA